MPPRSSTQTLEAPIPEGLYERVDILEHLLFEDEHLKKIAQTVSEVSDRYDGVCFVVWKCGVTSDHRFIYVPFKEEVDSYMTFDTLSAVVNKATCRLSEQLQQVITFH